jgi:hypothetical protein
MEIEEGVHVYLLWILWSFPTFYKRYDVTIFKNKTDLFSGSILESNQTQELIRNDAGTVDKRMSASCISVGDYNNISLSIRNVNPHGAGIYMVWLYDDVVFS